MTAIVWFRRDLRLHDHPALRAALDAHETVVPFFCLDDRLLHGRHASGPRTQFMLDCLADLDGALRERGPAWWSAAARPSASWRGLDELDAAEVHVTADVSPFARDAGGSSAQRWAIALRAHPGLTAVDDVPRSARRRAGPTRCLPRFTAPGSRSRAGR